MSQSQYSQMYPNLPIATEEETLKMIEAKNYIERVREMNKDKEQLMRELNDFKKKKKRWNRIDAGIKIVGIVVISVTGVATIVCGVVMPPLMIPIVATGASIGVGVAGVVESVVLSGVTLGWTEKKKKHYKHKIQIAQSHIDKKRHSTPRKHIIYNPLLNSARNCKLIVYIRIIYAHISKFTVHSDTPS